MEFADQGSALAMIGTKVSWTDTNSKFSDNYAKEGGAVYIYNPETVSLTGTKFTQNIG